VLTSEPPTPCHHGAGVCHPPGAHRIRAHNGLECNLLCNREGSRQAEYGEDSVFEAGHGADSVAGESEDEEAGSVDSAGGVSVDPECRLTVGSRRHQFESLYRAENECEETGHDVSALVFQRHWWHRHEDVIGQQSDQRFDVGGFVGADELRHDSVLGTAVQRRYRVDR